MIMHNIEITILQLSSSPSSHLPHPVLQYLINPHPKLWVSPPLPYKCLTRYIGCRWQHLRQKGWSFTAYIAPERANEIKITFIIRMMKICAAKDIAIIPIGLYLPYL